MSFISCQTQDLVLGDHLADEAVLNLAPQLMESVLRWSPSCSGSGGAKKNVSFSSSVTD